MRKVLLVPRFELAEVLMVAAGVVLIAVLVYVI
jgi:hypothetical protein